MGGFGVEVEVEESALACGHGVENAMMYLVPYSWRFGGAVLIG